MQTYNSPDGQAASSDQESNKCNGLAAIAFDAIAGQVHALRLLRRLIEKDRLPHAMLFSGIDGCGRQTCAKATAMVINCMAAAGSSACGQCRSCRKMEAGVHPDLVVVKPSTVLIKIDQIRALYKEVRHAPLEGQFRVIVINDAQTMNSEAANALLKLLEEPPRGTIFILTATEANDLLPTIVSRCQKISFQPLPATQIADYLVLQRKMKPQHALVLSTLSCGSLGKAISADHDELMALRNQVVEVLGACRGKSLQPLFSFAEAMARDKESLEAAITLMGIWLRDLLMLKIGAEVIVNKDLTDHLCRASDHLSAGQLLDGLESILERQYLFRKNVNARLAMETMLIRLQSVLSGHA